MVIFTVEIHDHRKLIVTDGPMGKVSQLVSERQSFQLGCQQLELCYLYQGTISQFGLEAICLLGYLWTSQ